MIAIICAIEQEVKAITKVMQETTKKSIMHMDVYEGKIADHLCVMALAGVGKVNAAMSATLLIDHYDVDTLINVGVAGGLKSDQETSDIVISKRVIQHDFDTSFIDGEEGMGLTYECDADLITKCSQILEANHVRYFIGDTASGDSFVGQNDYLKRIQKLFPDCISTEMEAGAISQVCANADIPCLIIRSLSDIAVKENNHLDFLEFAQEASHQAAWLAQALIEKL